MEEEEEYYDYIAIPLKQDMRCKSQTENGQCTNDAEWQIYVSDDRKWKPCCYHHMHLVMSQYKTQQIADEQLIEKIAISRIPTSKLLSTTRPDPEQDQDQD